MLYLFRLSNCSVYYCCSVVTGWYWDYLQDIFFSMLRRFIYTAIYLAMGWMAIVVIKDIVRIMDTVSLWYLFLGGAAFTIGALFYIIKWPHKNNGYIGFHEIFHGFILAGAFFHYMMVYHSIQYIQNIH